MVFTIAIKEIEDGWLMGQCEQIPEAITQGKDMEELMENIQDAIELCLEYKQDEYRRLNNPTTIMPLSIIHEKKRTNKASQRERVYA